MRCVRIGIFFLALLVVANSSPLSASEGTVDRNALNRLLSSVIHSSLSGQRLEFSEVLTLCTSVDPSIVETVLLDQVSNQNLEVRRTLMWDPCLLPTSVLEKMSRDSDPYVRSHAACDKLSPASLYRLTKDSSVEVRASLALGVTDHFILSHLYCDQDKDVRDCVASNRHTDPVLLTSLSYDPENTIRESVAKNNNTSGESLLRLAHDSSSEVKRAVAENPNTPPQALALLAVDPQVGWATRGFVAKNPSTSPETLMRLLSDQDDTVRATAARALKKRGLNR